VLLIQDQSRIFILSLYRESTQAMAVWEKWFGSKGKIF
jgi:hypothetical protein